MLDDNLTVSCPMSETVLRSFSGGGLNPVSGRRNGSKKHFYRIDVETVSVAIKDCDQLQYIDVTSSSTCEQRR